MPTNDPPVTVKDLVAKVTASQANIIKHRKAMAEVAATAKANAAQPPPVEAKP